MRITISVNGMPKVRRTRELIEGLERCIWYVTGRSDWKPDTAPEIRFLSPTLSKRTVVARIEAVDQLDHALKKLLASLVDSVLETHAPPSYSTACHVLDPHCGVVASECTLAEWRRAA